MTHQNPFESSPDRQDNPSPQEIREELERLLASSDFQASEKRCAFLRYIVDETLAGHSGNLKGYTIAVAVFERDESFDAQSDPVVRVEARRLRRDLDSYYMNAGNEHTLRISIPKGAYVPHFEDTGPDLVPTSDFPVSTDGRSTENNTMKSGSSWWKAHHLVARQVSLAVVVLAVLITAATTWILRAGVFDPDQGKVAYEPAVLVLPFKSLDASPDSQYLADGVSQLLINDLMKFQGFRLYSPRAGTTPVARENNGPQTPLQDTAYVVSGSVQQDAEGVLVTAELVFSATGEVVWSERYQQPLDAGALIRSRLEMSDSIATALGQPYGLIQSDLSGRLTVQNNLTMKSYSCVLRAYYYRRNFSRTQYDSILNCLEEATRNNPGYSDAWAMLGWLYLDAGRYEFHGRELMQQEYDEAFKAASHALVLEPDNTLALKALSAINHYLGNYTESERLARKALELNPNDPDTMAQLGWRLAVRGNFDEGIPLLQQAIDRTINPPGWYFHLLAVDRLMEGDFEQMLAIAQRSAVDGSDFSQALIAIADVKLGDQGHAQLALDRLSESGLLARDPAAYFQRHGATTEITKSLVDGLIQAHRVAGANPRRYQTSSR